MLIDDAILPTEIANMLYIDMRADYDQSLAKIVAATTQRPPETIPKLDDLIEIRDVVENVATEQKEFRGSGYFITTFLSIVTIVVAAIAAVPSFYMAFGKHPLVYYSINEKKLIILRKWTRRESLHF